MKRLFLKRTHPDGREELREIKLQDAPMNSGGEGSIYRVAGNDSWPVKYGNITVTKRACAKIYDQAFLAKHGKEVEKKLQFMINPKNRPGYLDDGAAGLIQICYPFSLLYEADGTFVGFMMYMALDGSVPLSTVTVEKSPAFFKTQRRLGRLNPLVENVYSKFQFAFGFQPTVSRYALVYNMAGIINYMHETGRFVIVDLKPDNFLINSRGGVSLVDVNTVQVHDGSMFYPSLVATPDYVPPEHQANPSGRMPSSFDLFSMAVVFYQTLVGIHPFAYSIKGGGTNGTSVTDHIRSGEFACGKSRMKFTLCPQHQRFDNLPGSIKYLFTRAFEGPPSQRPTAREWMDAMKSIRKGYNGDQKKAGDGSINGKPFQRAISRIINRIF